ncbi:MAG TPA: glycosyltransferase family 4 protein [Ktedonobacterales bacterium]|jgi:glycosyltransferase involved in cell wall biosynthesis
MSEMTSLRVATITFDFYPFDPRVRRLAEAAADAGDAVDVICLRQPGEKRFESYNNVRIYRVPMERGFGRSLPMTMLAWLAFLLLAGATVSWLHLKRGYAVVHVHNMPDFLVFAALFPRLLGAKVILDVQDVSPELMGAKAKGTSRKLVTRLAIWQERISTRFAQHVVTVGWPFEEALLQRGVRQEKLSILLNSADPKMFPAARRQPPPGDALPAGQPLILMYHGTLAHRTGLDVAMRAFAQARQRVPHLQFHIQGRGESKPALKQLAEELGVDDAVVFTDPCPSDKIVDFVVHGDVGVIPYRVDGFEELVLPTKAYEFAWMQRPMIASDTRGIRSMFRAESIVLCEPDNVEAFAAAMVDLAQHQEKRAALVANATVDYLPYRWEVMAERYQHLLTALSRKQVGLPSPQASE